LCFMQTLADRETGRMARPVPRIFFCAPEMEAERLNAVHEARVKIVPRV
jgi:hypothetical protein